jgi:putative hemolysin
MIRNLFIKIFKYLLGVTKLENIYAANRDEVVKLGLWSSAVKHLNLPIQVHADELNHIPTEGPTIIVSNHPFGAADGLILGYLVEQKRKDFKLFVTSILPQIAPEAKQHFLDVELYNKTTIDRTKNNVVLDSAIEYVKNGGCLIVFPAGTPSQAKRLFGKAIDLEWRSGVSKIIHGSKATVVPVFFEGQNSRLFQIVGLLFRGLKTARTLLLGRELLRRMNKPTQVKIGSNIAYSTFEGLDHPETLSRLRSRVYMLRKPGFQAPQKFAEFKKNLIPHKFRKSSKVYPIIDPIPTSKLTDFLQTYKTDHPDSVLIESNRYSVLLIDGSQCSEDFLLELGRLREVTFRVAGEGTGKRCDIDEHDAIYHHLIVWNEKKQWISGSYRLGLSPFVLKQRGLRGFYTQPFFNFQTEFLNKLGDSIELGRSFVRAEEQSQWILFYLWKGIAKFFLLQPNYVHMFGSVSISKDYSERSRQIISKYFMNRHGADEDLKSYISPEIPYDYKSDLKDFEVENILKTIPDRNTLSKVVADLETDLKEVPVLVYRYAELGAKYLTFTVDPDFGYTLDGFIVVPIKKIPREQMKKYLSEDEVNKFFGLVNESHPNA